MKSPAACWLWLLLCAALPEALYALAPALVAADTKKASGSLQQEENETNEEDEGSDDDEEEDDSSEVPQSSNATLALTQIASQPSSVRSESPGGSPPTSGAADTLPANFDAISFLAETETAEEAASAAEAEAMVAEAAAVRSAARLRKAQQRRAAGGSEEDRQMAETSLHAAQAAWEQRAPKARDLAAGARKARSAALQRAAEVNSNLGASSLLRAFGPGSCVSTWRDASSGTCFLKTDCEGVQSFDSFDVGFLCENSGQEPVEHRFGLKSFARAEVQDTAVSCERCLPTQDKQQTAESLSQEMHSMKQSLTKVSETLATLQQKASELLR